MSEPESAQDFHARVVAATGPDGRLPVSIEEMPGWDIYPYEIDSLSLDPREGCDLPPVPDEVVRTNTAYVVDRLVDRVGGEAGPAVRNP